MTCPGGFGDDECGAVLRDVWLFLDDELDPDRRATVQRHLDDCSPCLEQAGLESKLKELLARKCGGEQAPERLRERIVAGLAQWRGTVSADGVVTSSMTATSVTVQWDAPPESGQPDTGAQAGTGGKPAGGPADVPGRL